MRLLVDSLIALMLVAVLGGIFWHRHAAEDQIQRVEATQQALRAIEAQALYQASLGEVPKTRWGYPHVVEPSWFKTRPDNLLAQCDRWIDVADESDSDRMDPAHVTSDHGRAAFWYNPHRGLIRARVEPQMSMQATIDLYNLVNGTSLRVDDAMWAMMR